MVVRRNKETVKDRPNIRPEPHFFSPNQAIIMKFIKKHPNCIRRDIYNCGLTEDTVRRDLTKLLRKHKVKETFTII